MGKIIDGKKMSQEIRKELREEVEKLNARGVTPGLGVVLVGEEPASKVYVRMKTKACAEVGVYEETKRIPEDASEEEVLRIIKKLNEDTKFHGILVQLPLPKHIDTKKILFAISPAKDVDAFHPENVGKLVIGEERYLPCTPHGILEMLRRSNVTTEGKHVVVVGRSNIVGKPLANLLLQKKPNGNATVTVCHSRTPDLGAHTRQADILIAAAGSAELIKADMVKEDAVVIDVGVNRVEDPTSKRGYRLVGDVDFQGVKEKASAISPVPGGVGPMTVTMLLFNVIKAAKELSKGSQN